MLRPDIAWGVNPVHDSRPTLSLSYGGRLPSSFASILSSALGYSPRLPVSVCGTGTFSSNADRGFSRKHGLTNSQGLLSPGRLTSRHPRRFFPTGNIPTGFQGRIRRDPLATLLRPRSCSVRWRRNINPLSIPYAFRPRVRSRLTLGGLTLPRKP